MLKTVGLELDEISVLERDDIDFEKRIIHGATKDYEEVEPCILALIQEGMANAFFFDGRFYQDLMWSDLVIQPVRRRPMELTEASVRNMLLRMSKYGKNSDFKDKSFAPTDLMTSYVFSKLYEYECISGERVLNKIGRDPVEPYWGEIDRWSGMRLKSFKARKSFIKEYIEWKEFYNKRV